MEGAEGIVKHILLMQMDGRLPNLALMRLAKYWRDKGRVVELRQARNILSVERDLYDVPYEAVFASLIFEKSRNLAVRLREVYPKVILGGTGWDETLNLEAIGVDGENPDYQDYPNCTASIGYTQRGCRFSCGFCKVPKAEGKVRPVQSIRGIWRGEPHPRHILLLDNDFFGQPRWRRHIEEISSGGFKVSFNQGINIRTISEEAAASISSVSYWDDGFKTRRLYTAWDNQEDERTFFRGANALVRHGVKPDHLMVYVLCGYWPGETIHDCIARIQKLRAFGCRPYPMPYIRSKELVGLQRWVVGAYDKRVSWEDWVHAGYEPRRLGFKECNLFEGKE